MRGDCGQMRPHLPQILAFRLATRASLRHACRERSVRFGQHHAMSRHRAVAVDKVRVRAERARKARGIVSPRESQRVHQQVRDPCTDASREGCSLGVSQRMEMLRQCEGRSVLYQPFHLCQGTVTPARQHFRRCISKRRSPSDRSCKRTWPKHKRCVCLRRLETDRNGTRLMPMPCVATDSDHLLSPPNRGN